MQCAAYLSQQTRGFGSQVALHFLTRRKSQVLGLDRPFFSLVTLGDDSCIAETIRNHSLHPVLLHIVVKRTILYIFIFHSCDNYMFKSGTSQELISIKSVMSVT
ncbi:uncharacterized protein METZ01_LOCUS173150 [marine metagenome]|uniref:Uncharacterized protein n=1 Tax=marine metagenome TaxID=408172 RepID=A0A382C2K4_9ZZZZ